MANIILDAKLLNFTALPTDELYEVTTIWNYINTLIIIAVTVILLPCNAL